MSSSIVPLKVVKLMDNKFLTGDSREYAVVQGSSNQTWRNYPSTSLSNNNINVICNPPSPQTFVNDCIYLKWTVVFTFSWTATGAGEYGVDLNGYDGLRMYPISAACENYSIILNNYPFTLNIKRFWPAICRYHADKHFVDSNSISPNMPDYYFNYEDGYGSNNNPLGGYNDSNPFIQTRGSFIFDTITGLVSSGAGAQTTVIKATITEPMFINPFSLSRDKSGGICNVTSLQINCVMSNLNRMWSRATNAGGRKSATLSTSIESASALINFLSLPFNMQVPSMVVLPYYYASDQITNVGSVAALTEVTRSINSLQFNSIPKKVYVFVGLSQQNLTEYTTDTYAVITNVSINFNNQPNILSDASIQDLYSISHCNGLDMSFQQFASTYKYQTSSTPKSLPCGVGSVICLEIGKDISLNDPVLCSGVGGGMTYNFAMQISFKNPTNATLDYSIYTIIVYEGVVAIDKNECKVQLGVLQQKDVLDAREMKHGYIASGSIYGMGWFSDTINWVKDAGRDVIDFVRGAKKLVPGVADALGIKNKALSKALEYSNRLDKASKKLGYGMINRDDL